MQDVAFRDRAAYLPTSDTLVIADVHVGRDESSSVAFPLGERANLHRRLTELLAHFAPATVVFAGDVLHEFSHASDAVERSFAELIDVCRDVDATPVLVRGNHDVHLAEVWDGEIHDAYRLADGTVVCHGHEHPDLDGERYLFGHDHPAISVEGQKRPCYLTGDAVYRDADVLVLPAFNRLAAGTRVNHMDTDDFQSPLVTDAGALRPVVYDPDVQETLEFPPLSEFRQLL